MINITINNHKKEVQNSTGASYQKESNDTWTNEYNWVKVYFWSWSLVLVAFGTLNSQTKKFYLGLYLVGFLVPLSGF